MGQLLEKALTYSINKGYINSAEADRTRKVVQTISAKHGMPEEWLVKLVFVEASGFNPRAGGRCVGVVQLCRGNNRVESAGGIREIGGYQGFINAGPAKQLELWDKYYLSYWLRLAKRNPQSQGELMLVNILPARYLDIAAGRANGNTRQATNQASFLYTDFNPATGRRTGGGYWSANSASKGMDYKVKSILGSGVGNLLTDSTVASSNTLGNLVTNAGEVINQALGNLGAGIQSALLRGENCPPPLYTQQDRIIYPGCLKKTSNPIFGNGLGSGSSAPGVTSIKPNEEGSQVAAGNTEPYKGELKPGGLINPMKKGTYRVTSRFGPRWGRQHRGIDLGAPIGTPIYASADGIVSKTVTTCPVNGFRGNNCGNFYGNQIIINHRGSNTLYAHLASVKVTKGQTVKQGQQIGTVGNSGSSTGAHLHFETRLDGRGAVNPDNLIKF